MKKNALLRLVLMALLLLTTTVIRAGDVQYLTIMVQGKPVSFALSDKPGITYQNNQLVVTTAEETIEIPVADISGTSFEETSTAIRNLMSGGKPQIQGGLVCFTDLTPGTPVQVFTADGRSVAEAKSDANGTVQVSLSELPKGTYLLKAGKRTIKMMNK